MRCKATTMTGQLAAHSDYCAKSPLQVIIVLLRSLVAMKEFESNAFKNGPKILKQREENLHNK